MEHKIEILLKESEYNFDSKNITNKGFGKVSNDIINQIESSGITSEMLGSFPFPIFRYRTQITLHGTFETDKNYFISGGYKNLIVNKNKSLGVKYSAIDIQKKLLIGKILRLEGSRFSLDLDSTSCRIISVLHYSEANLETAKQVFQGLPKNYIGFSQLYISSSFYGRFIVINIVLNAIHESELFNFVSGLLGKPYSLETYLANKLKKEEEDRQKYLELEQKQKLEKQNEFEAFESAKNKFFTENKVKFIHSFACGRYLYLSYEYNELIVNCLHIYKVKNGMLMYYSEQIRDLKNIPGTDCHNYKRKQLKDFKLNKIKEKLNKNYYFKLI